MLSELSATITARKSMWLDELSSNGSAEASDEVAPFDVCFTSRGFSCITKLDVDEFEIDLSFRAIWGPWAGLERADALLKILIGPIESLPPLTGLKDLSIPPSGSAWMKQGLRVVCYSKVVTLLLWGTEHFDLPVDFEMLLLYLFKSLGFTCVVRSCIFLADFWDWFYYFFDCELSPCFACWLRLYESLSSSFKAAVKVSVLSIPLLSLLDCSGHPWVESFSSSSKNEPFSVPSC